MRKQLLIGIALFLLLGSCAKEQAGPSSKPGNGKQVTIRVSMPEDAFSKVDFTDTGDKLHLSWHGDETIRVISGETSKVYTLTNRISDHEAEFTGDPVSGTSFDILIPGSYATVEEAEEDTATPTQTGNGSTAHLRYKALLSGVNSYTDIAFSSTWASAHGGTLKQGAAVKLVALLPPGVTTLKKAGVMLGNSNYTLPLSGVDVSASSQVLTAYMMLPWENIALPDGSKVSAYVLDSGNEAYGAQVSVSGNKTVEQGKMNSFGANEGNVVLLLQDFVAGDGTSANPYLIANARQLNNMHNSGILVSSEKKYFRLLEDVDATSITNWDPLNNSGTFDKEMDFDGDGHTIDHLTSSGKTYGSFAGVLYGHIHDVTFDHASITASSKSGVVAGFLGTATNDYARRATCTNVTVINSTVTNSSAAAGGFTGHVRGKGAVTGCKVINTTVNGVNTLGGFAGLADISGLDKYEVPAIFTNCEVDGVTINQNKNAAATNIYTGGFIGETYQAHSFITCHVKGTTITANKAAVANVGGFVGYTDYAGANFQGCTVDSGTSITAKGDKVGGFVGYAAVPDAYKSCSSAAAVNVEASSVGGFVGWACGSAAFTACSATGNVTGQRFTAGFAGVTENASFTDCYYSGGTITGNTTNSDARIGGFIGSCVSGTSLQGCYVSGATLSASGAGRVGGFAGQLGSNSAGGNNVTANQCHVTNTSVSGATNTGGFSGVQYENASRCYVSGGSVTANGNNCGGFTGFVHNGNINDCFTTANVVGGSYSPVGGFAGVLYTTNISYCYSAGAISGSGSNKGAFVGQCTQQGTQAVADIDHCIGWDASLPFCALNTVGASITNSYAGNSGTVSSQATAQTWPSAVWNLEGSIPVLLDVPRRIAAIFVGDSITWQWARNSGDYSKSQYPLKIDFNPAYMTDNGTTVTVKFHPGFFSGNGYIDKGISGQNTTQMRSRFQKDVIELNPKVVVIMGGTNDLAQGVAKEDIVTNIAAMAQMATEAGICVVLCSVTPNNDSYSKLNPKNKGTHIIALNEMIQALVAAQGYTYCNYWTSLVADDGLALKEAYRLYDNLHPGPDGYDVMEPIIKPIIDGLL